MILPVILGTDVNAYGMARMFHMKYSVKSLLIGQGKLFMTNHSSICNLEIVPNFLEDEIFKSTLIDIGREFLKNYEKLILIASSDAYAELSIKYKDELSIFFFMPFIKPSLLSKLSNKKVFYETAREYGLPYPETSVITKDNYKDIKNPFGYPSVLKASSSIEYSKIEFEGKKKAFILKDDLNLKSVLKKIYESTDYDKEMLLQDFIPGDDSKMFVLNAYVNKSAEVKMMSLGHVVMEDPTPELIGNYLAIVGADGEKVYPVYKRFLENLGYTGFANFDMKYDERDGIYKVFEINLRQGRSSFFSALSGANLAQAVTDDALDNRNYMIVGSEDFLWLGAEAETILKYVRDDSLKEKMERLIFEGKCQTTLTYEADENFIRDRAVKKYYDAYDERFNKFFVEK